MITVEVKRRDLWNEETNEFIHVSGGMLQLKHSLSTISKWEAKWKKVFLVVFGQNRGRYHISDEEFKDYLIDYLQCMIVSSTVYPHKPGYDDGSYDDDIYKYIDQEGLTKVMEYINDPQTPTRVLGKPSPKNSSETLSAVYIYAYMASYRIPFKCEDWHLNKLLTLIEVCGILNSPKDKRKRSRREIIEDYERINAQRRAKYKTKG